MTPLPTPLAEQQVVTVWIQPVAETSRELSEAEIAERQAAWHAFFAEIERLPHVDAPINASGDRDEDRLIYEDSSQ